jgi:hypothetical protein
MVAPDLAATWRYHFLPMRFRLCANPLIEIDAGLAQTVEQLICDRNAAGSIPAPAHQHPPVTVDANITYQFPEKH